MLKILLLILFLTLFLTCSNVFAQGQKKKDAIKIFDYEKVSNVLLKEKSDDFNQSLKENLHSQGFIINYGTLSEIARRRKQQLRFINIGDVHHTDGVRITFVDVENDGKPKTVIWIVPSGAKLPEIEDENK